MRSNVDSVLMSLPWVLIYVKGCPVPYNFRYLPLVWRSYQPSCLLPSRPCLYSKIRCLYMPMYVSPAPLYNISYVVFTTYIVCTSPWCGEIIFPHACCRPDRVCIAIEWVSCWWWIYCLRRQSLGMNGLSLCFSRSVWRMLSTASVLLCIYLSHSVYAVHFCRYADDAAVSAMYVRT